jgi:hypothetical protein
MGDVMFTENFQRSADGVCSRDAPCIRAKYWDKADVEGGKVSNLLSDYTETAVSITEQLWILFLKTLIRNKASRFCRMAYSVLKRK